MAFRISMQSRLLAARSLSNGDSNSRDGDGSEGAN